MLMQRSIGPRALLVVSSVMSAAVWLAAATHVQAIHPARGQAATGCAGGCGQPGCNHCGSCGHGCRGGHCCYAGPGLLNHHCGHCDGHCIHHDTIEKRYFLRSQGKSWHSGWYNPADGRPIALVVPPTAEFESQYAWGVPSSRVMPLYHQFRRPYPGPGALPGSGGAGFLPTPNQPSDTVQFGVNAVRGPWGGY
jgi:hypothetical protein